jgi:hypothetical protein
MSSPFPGMDPYLEACGAWSDFHSNLLVFLKRALNQSLPSGFNARTEERVYIVPDERDIRPDVTVFAVAPNRPASGRVAVLERPTLPERVARPTHEVIERFIEIRDVRQGSRDVVTVLEVLSPANKREGSIGRTEYLRKQKALLQSATNLIEIDLLRDGIHTVCIPREPIQSTGAFDYLVTRADADNRDEFLFWRIFLHQPLPIVLIPLLPSIPEVKLDLQAAIEECWEASHYDNNIDYATPLLPAPSPEEAKWIASVTAMADK